MNNDKAGYYRNKYEPGVLEPVSMFKDDTFHYISAPAPRLTMLTEPSPAQTNRSSKYERSRVLFRGITTQY